MHSLLAAGDGWPGSCGSVANRAWLCHLNPWAPKAPWFFRGLTRTAWKAGLQALLSSLVLARHRVRQSCLPILEPLGTWAGGRSRSYLALRQQPGPPV